MRARQLRDHIRPGAMVDRCTAQTGSEAGYISDPDGAPPSHACVKQGYVVAQMLYWFKKSGLGTTLADVQQLFYKFRSRGMRLHYWP